jgi:hypothetical protein
MSQQGLTVPQALVQFRLNAQAASGRDPVLVYTRVENTDGSPALAPDLIMPQSLDNPALRDWAGGIFTVQGMRFQGKSGVSNQLYITGHLSSESGLIEYSGITDLTRERRQYVTQNTVTQYTSVRKFFRHKRRHHIETLECRASQPGGGECAMGVVFHQVGRVNDRGWNTLVDNQGIQGQIEHHRIQPNIDAQVICDQAVVRNTLCKAKITQYRRIPTLISGGMHSVGLIQITGKTLAYQGSQIYSQDYVRLHGTERTDICHAIITERAAPVYVKKQGLLMLTTGTDQVGLSTQIQGALGTEFSGPCVQQAEAMQLAAMRDTQQIGLSHFKFALGMNSRDRVPQARGQLGFVTRSYVNYMACEPETNIIDQFLIGFGRNMVGLGQGIKALYLRLAAKCRLKKPQELERYVQDIREEARLYENTEVGQSVAGRLGASTSARLNALVLPTGLGLVGKRLLFSAASAGAILGGLEPTEDGSMRACLHHMAAGAAMGTLATGQKIGGNWVVKQARDKLK